MQKFPIITVWILIGLMGISARPVQQRQLLDKKTCATANNPCPSPHTVCEDSEEGPGYRCVCAEGYHAVSNANGNGVSCKEEVESPGNDGAAPVAQEDECVKPSWWCGDANSQILQHTDCDGDGTLDWVCTEPATGSRAVLLSSKDCALDAAGWPNAPASLCPSILTGPACSRPSWWCGDANSQILQHTDCDGDGTPDWVCTEPATGSRAVLLSSRGCDNTSSAATGWPSAPADLCPSVLSGPPCARPNWWCSEPTSQLIEAADCDGDGSTDWVCTQPATGYRGVLLSSQGCDPGLSGWPNAPASLCPGRLQD